MSKQVQKVCNAISTAAVVLVVILALLLVGVRLVGLRPMCVLSGSMEPTYHTGSLIYVKPCAPEDVQVGDAITFVLNEDLDVVTHRVISIDAENEHFYTQGDANDAPDGAPVYFKNLIGRPVFTIPYLGYVSHWVSNPPGMYLAIAIAIVLHGSGVPAGHAAQGVGGGRARRGAPSTRRTNPAMHGCTENSGENHE
ncbi:MAG: signal peptidase I [Oscillospiraceae bacterium]